MRYAIITDIHANIFALKVALKEIDEKKPDKIICLGDIVGNGAYPEETVQFIRKRGDILCVKGNHDLFANLNLKLFSFLLIRLTILYLKSFKINLRWCFC